MIRLIQPGNSKLFDAYMFNMHAGQQLCGRSCPSCYAIKEQIRFPSVMAARVARYQASLQPDFASRIISELHSLKKPPRWCRIHASGDFYSQTYIDSWHTIISQCPTIGFYAYTKRLKDFDFSALRSLPNMSLVDSFHFGGLNYGPLSAAPPGAFVCPSSDTVRCGIECCFCQTPGQADTFGIYFQKH